jgi:hypothetical protein
VEGEGQTQLPDVQTLKAKVHRKVQWRLIQ